MYTVLKVTFAPHEEADSIETRYSDFVSFFFSFVVFPKFEEFKQ